MYVSCKNKRLLFLFRLSVKRIAMTIFQGSAVEKRTENKAERGDAATVSRAPSDVAATDVYSTRYFRNIRTVTDWCVGVSLYQPARRLAAPCTAQLRSRHAPLAFRYATCSPSFFLASHLFSGIIKLYKNFNLNTYSLQWYFPVLIHHNERTINGRDL